MTQNHLVVWEKLIHCNFGDQNPYLSAHTSLGSLLRTRQIKLGLHPDASLKLNHLFKISVFKYGHIGGRGSTYEFWEDIIQSKQWVIY